MHLIKPILGVLAVAILLLAGFGGAHEKHAHGTNPSAYLAASAGQAPFRPEVGAECDGDTLPSLGGTSFLLGVVCYSAGHVIPSESSGAASLFAMDAFFSGGTVISNSPFLYCQDLDGDGFCGSGAVWPEDPFLFACGELVLVWDTNWDPGVEVFVFPLSEPPLNLGPPGVWEDVCEGSQGASLSDAQSVYVFVDHETIDL